MTFWQRFKERLKEGFEPTYIVRNSDEVAPVRGLKKRGIGWTRASGATSKVRRLMARASRRRNRSKKKRRRKRNA